MRLSLPVVVLAAVAFGGLYYQYGRQNAPLSDRAGLPILTGVVIPELVGDAIIGQRVFAENCSQCHGENAVGAEEIGPPLIHKTYKPSRHGDAAFLLAARNGVRSHHWRYGKMLPVEGVSDAEISMVVAYVRALQRANGIN